MKKDIIEKLSGLAVIFLLIVFVVWFFDFENLQDQIISAGFWGPVILILLKIATVVFAPLSGAALYPLAGAIFGFWEGFLYVMIGDTVGAVIAFFISRSLGQKIVERFLRKKNMPAVEKVMRAVETTGGLIFARICFAAMPEIFAYAVGLTKTKFSKFFIVNFVIEIIPVAILVWGGDYLVFLKSPLMMFFFVAFGMAVVFVGGFIFYKFTQSTETKYQSSSSIDDVNSKNEQR